MTLTRRTALAAPALLALPSAALARQAEPDPVIAVAEELIALVQAFGSLPNMTDAECDAMGERVAEIEHRLSSMVARTPAGLAAQLRAGAHVIGNPDRNSDFATLAGFDFYSPAGTALYSNLLAAAAAMATGERVGA